MACDSSSFSHCEVSTEAIQCMEREYLSSIMPTNPLSTLDIDRHTCAVYVWGSTQQEAEDRARRIAACVNACKDVSTEDLEQRARAERKPAAWVHKKLPNVVYTPDEMDCYPPEEKALFTPLYKYYEATE